MKSIIKLNNNYQFILIDSTLIISTSFGSTKILLLPGIKLIYAKNKMIISSIDIKNLSNENFGTFLSLFKNAISGLDLRYTKTLKISGSGYKFVILNNNLLVFAGSTKTNILQIPKILTITLVDSTRLIISGINKHLVGLFAEKIRHIYPIEPYKLRGISYADEIISKKEGKKRK